MELTDKARQRLIRLLPKGRRGFRFEGYVGTCRGSAPIIKPADAPGEDEQLYEVEGISFFTNAENLELLVDSHLDYDPTFFGRGLTMTWPHREGCACDF